MSNMGNKSVMVGCFILFLILMNLALLYKLYADPRIQIVIFQSEEQTFQEQNSAMKYQQRGFGRIPILQRLHYLSKVNNNKDLEKLEEKQPLQAKSQCAVVDDAYKFDCYPETFIATKEKCEARGCCWQVGLSDQTLDKKNLSGGVMGVPFCYYPKDFPGYKTGLKAITPTGFTVGLTRNTTGFYPDDIMTLVMDVRYETDYRLRIRVSNMYLYLYMKWDISLFLRKF